MISINELTKFYDGVCAVDNVSFRVEKGEVLGLLGPNGAGKTTIMRVLTCYLRPTSGDITIKDSSIYDDPVAVKKLIGYLPESAPLYHEMLVYDFLKFVADVREIERSRTDSRIKELAAMCGINEVMHKPVDELSKGYKQRVGLAHAMMNDPEILVLDEPTSGLDPNQIIEIRDIIKNIGREKTVIFSTHILSEAEATCDRIVIINKGKIVADGAADDLKREAGGGYTIHISLQSGDIDEINKVLQGIPGVKGIIPERSEDGILNLHIACGGDRDMRPEIYGIIRDNDWPLLEMHRKTRTLETIFKELTRED